MTFPPFQHGTCSRWSQPNSVTVYFKYTILKVVVQHLCRGLLQKKKNQEKSSPPRCNRYAEMHTYNLSQHTQRCLKGGPASKSFGSLSCLHWRERAGGGRNNGRVWGPLSQARALVCSKVEAWAKEASPQASGMWLSELSLATTRKSQGLCSLSFEGSKAAGSIPNQDARRRKPSERPGQLSWQMTNCPWSQDKQSGAFTAISTCPVHPAPSSQRYANLTHQLRRRHSLPPHVPRGGLLRKEDGQKHEFSCWP